MNCKISIAQRSSIDCGRSDAVTRASGAGEPAASHGTQTISLLLLINQRLMELTITPLSTGQQLCRSMQSRLRISDGTCTSSCKSCSLVGLHLLYSRLACPALERSVTYLCAAAYRARCAQLRA